MGPLSTVRQELLVRYLDAWTPTALHGAHPSPHRSSHSRRLTYVDAHPSGSVSVAALGVFVEFADVLAGHRLTVLLGPADPELVRQLGELAGGVDGLEVRPVPGDLLSALRDEGALTAPVLAYIGRAQPEPVLGGGAHAPGSSVRAQPGPVLGGGGHAPGPSAPAQPQPGLGGGAHAASSPDPDGPGTPAPALLAALGGARAGEVFIALDPAALSPGNAQSYRRSLRDAGFGLAVAVELVDNADRAQLLFFATSAMRGLERFKDALWAVDEYAGVRYRDPRTADHPPLDISLEPNVGPLRRALLARVTAHGGEVTVAQLREFALAETLYRPADVNRALPGLLAAGQLRRDPARGRLTAQTVVSAPATGR